MVKSSLLARVVLLCVITERAYGAPLCVSLVTNPGPGIGYLVSDRNIQGLQTWFRRCDSSGRSICRGHIRRTYIAASHDRALDVASFPTWASGAGHMRCSPVVPLRTGK